MVSDLHIKISDVLGKYLADTPMPEKKAIALVDELADLLAAQPIVQSDVCLLGGLHEWVTNSNGEYTKTFCGKCGTRR